jgi:hypothetical protein
MTSQINPNNIDGSYPVAGQDNNSQGFRDNFTNTGTNFQYAASEITDLQNKAVLKAALTGTTLSNNMLGSPLSNALLSDMAYAAVQLGGPPGGGTITIDYTAGQFYTVTANNDISLAFTNWPDAGNYGVVTVAITVSSAAYTVTFPTAVSINTAGVQGLDTATNIMSFAAAGVYTFTFSTVNNGLAIALSESNKQLQPYNATSEVWADGAGDPINLGVTTTFFASGTNTPVLPDGVEGQIIVLIQSTVTAAVVAVTNYGWDTGTTVGQVELTNIGESATLMFTNGAWYCIGNNGGLFAYPKHLTLASTSYTI